MPKPELILKLLRFGAVGLMVMVVFMGLNWTLAHWLHEQAAFLCAYPPSVGLHFALNKRWTFADRREATTRQVGEYLLMVAVTFVIQWSVFTALRTWTALPGWLAAGMANVAQMAVSFGMMQVRIFAAQHPSAGSVSGKRSGRRRTAYAAAAVLTLAWYGYANLRSNPGIVHREPVAFYDRLTEGFVAGQTYLKLAPDPRLKDLANPWAGAQGIPRAHDATYFNGRYYVYFGAAPVVLLLAPWRVLTGTYMADGVATGVFCATGFLLALLFYGRCQRRFFPELSAVWIFVFGLTLGLGAFVQFELVRTDFYQVPIACAFASSLGMANALLVVAMSAQVRRRLAALAIASLLGGLAVGARPNHIFALSSVAIVGGWCWRQTRVREGGPSAGWIWLSAVAAPAAAMGLGIAAYNYERFGSALEFGLSYQFAAVDMRTIKLFGFDRLGTAFEGYVLAGRDYSRYFPFIRQTSGNIGLLTWAPFSLIGLAWPLTWGNAGRKEQAWRLGVGALWWSAMVSFGSLMLYYYVFDRYVLDFLPALMVVACVMASKFIAEVPPAAGRRGAAIKWAVALLLVYTGVHSFVHGLPLAVPEIGRAARCFSGLSAWYDRVAGVRYGALEAEVVFPEGKAGATEGLLATGGSRDMIYVRYLDARRAVLQFYHRGAGGPETEPFDYEPGRRYRLRADLGSLYPPEGHPIYAGWSEAEIRSLRRRVDVRLDGRTLLRFASAFYDNEPGIFTLGDSPGETHGTIFRGQIRLTGRAGLPKRTQLVPPDERNGPVRLTLKLPPFTAQVAQPLVVTGRGGRGDVIYIFYMGPNLVRFGHDSWSSNPVETEPVGYDADEEHVLEVDFGALHTGSPLADGVSERLRLRFDGRMLFDAPRKSFPSSPEEVFIGHNAIAASTTEINFNGPRLAYERLRAWPVEPAAGARILTLRLPAERVVGKSEPLLATGRTGAGEVIYIKYTDLGHFQIGYDKWNYGGHVSAPIACRERQALVIEVSLGALYIPGVFDASGVDSETGHRLRSTVQVRVDGRVVLEQASESFPSRPEEITVGVNAIGASTCAEKFTGEIVVAEISGAARLK